MDEPILRYDHSAWVAVVFIKKWQSSKSAVDGGEKWLVSGRRVLFVQPLGVPVLTLSTVLGVVLIYMMARTIALATAS